MSKSIKYTVFLALSLLVLSSGCANRKNMVYFQKGEFDSIVKSAELYEMKFRKGDFLQKYLK